MIIRAWKSAKSRPVLMFLLKLGFLFQFLNVVWTATRFNAPNEDPELTETQNGVSGVFDERIKTTNLMDDLNPDITNKNLVLLQRLVAHNEALERVDRDDIGISPTSSTTFERRQFGKRGFGPITRFQVKENSGMEWVTYFYEETVIPVLQTKDRMLVDCTIVEVRQDWEQEEAMKFFGALMPAYPLSLTDMVQLITLCGSIHSKRTAVEEARHQSSILGNFVARPSFSTLIFPGTLWCGMKDNAKAYEDLGDRMELDRCCRAHDHCPVKLSSFEGRYGISSSGFTTKSHCLCELEFYRCLKGAESQTADMIGNFYFNVLNLDCLEKKKPSDASSANHEDSFRSLNPTFGLGLEQIYKCVEWDSNRKCRFWEKKENINDNYRTNKFKLRY